jgi:hypothetical protein
LQEAIPEGFPNRGYVWHGPLMNFGWWILEYI